jgi:hypothetical protein
MDVLRTHFGPRTSIPGHGVGAGASIARYCPPKLGDAPLIAVTRIAVARALELLVFTEQNIAQYGLRDGRLLAEGPAVIVGAVAAFDSHSPSEGSGIGTV